MVMISKILALT